MALRVTTIKAWYQVHKWTSLVCTAFLLMLCLTGLPLIFHHEIDHLLGNEIELAANDGAAAADLDDVVAAARQERPGGIVRFLSWDEDQPDLLFVGLAPTEESPPDDIGFVAVNGRTGESLGAPPGEGGIMQFILDLHINMFAGLPGMLFLGVMGLLFVIAVISGVVLYAPFMRKLAFGTVRRDRGRRLRWLDLHNLLGVVTVVWVLVVGATGTINTWVDLVIHFWRQDQLAEMIAPYEGASPLARLGSLQAAVDTAGEAIPGMTPSFVAFPGSMLSSGHHYAVFMRGTEPLTSRLVKPVLIDAASGAFTDSRELPWYVKTLLISQPLHFGDYGGLPLKIIWAVLDIVTIIVLASGLYLWLARRRSSVDERIAALVEEAAASPTGGGIR